MQQSEIITTIGAAMRDLTGAKALFLSGSHGTGHADAWSDIDFLLVCEGGISDAVAGAWREAIEQVGEIVLWWDRTTVPVLINAITRDWVRIDLVVLKPDQMAAHRQDRLRVVFDHDGVYDALGETTPPPAPNPRKFLYQIQEFIRILGLLHLVDGRGEYLNGVLGVFHLRNLLVDLLIEETAVPNRGGVLHLNRLITEEQKAVLAGLPVPEPERDAIIAAHMAYAEAYLPRAKARAGALGVEWPEAFEAATWEMLESRLEIARPG